MGARLMASRGNPTVLLGKLTAFLAVGLRRAGRTDTAIRLELEAAFRAALAGSRAATRAVARPGQVSPGAAPDAVGVYRRLLEDYEIGRGDPAWQEEALGVLREAIDRELVWRGKPPEVKRRWEIIRSKGPGALPPPKQKKQRPPEVRRPHEEPPKLTQEEKPPRKPKPAPEPSILIDHFVVCQMLGIRPGTWRSWVAKGLAPAPHSVMGSRFYYRRADIDHLIRHGTWPAGTRFRGWPANPAPD
jgi:hypothetical protein